MADKVFKIALDGYNAETDTNPNHFSLYVDQITDYFLIKEKKVDTITVNDSDNEVIAHGLGYIPFCLVFAEVSSGVWRKIYGRDASGGNELYFTVDSTNLTLYNNSGGNKDFTYHIFYDLIA